MDFSERLYSLIGKRVRAARQEAKFTQQELGEQVDLTRTSITNIEYGQQKIQIHTLYAIARVLNVSVTDFLPDIEEEEKEVEDVVLEHNMVIGEHGLEDLTKEERERIIELLTSHNNAQEAVK